MSTRIKSAIILAVFALGMIVQSSIPAYAQYRTPGNPGRTVSPAPIQGGPVGPSRGLVGDVVQDPPEIRALWSDGFGSPGPFDPLQMSGIINNMAAANMNTLILEVRKNGDAYYNSKYEPWASNIDLKHYPSYDPLGDALTKAHAKGIEVHAWLIAFRTWSTAYGRAPVTHVISQHPEWLDIANTGQTLVNNTEYWVDPAIPGVQQYISDVVKDIVSKYAVDGINFDRIRYPEQGYWYNNSYNIWGFSALAKQRFQREYGVPAPVNGSDPNYGAFTAFRRQAVSDVVRKCYLEAVHLNPKIKMSADTIGWSGGNPNVDFAGTRAYAEVFQDSKSWIEDHYLDLDVLMNYKREHNTAQQLDYRVWAGFLKSMEYPANNVHCVSGMGSYLNYITGSVAQVGYDQQTGLAGSAVYCARINDIDHTSGQWDPAFQTAMTSSVWLNPAPIPEMPWKEHPTAGILFGQVSDALEPNDPVYQNWIPKAQVTATDSIGNVHTTETDGTGTYAFFELPPGTYTIGVSVSGYTPASASAAVTAGLAAKQDVVLGPIVPAQNYKTLAQAGDPNQTPDGMVTGLTAKVVTVNTGTFPECIYVEEANRSHALQVRLSSAAAPVVEGDSVTLIGRMNTANGERYLDHGAIVVKTSATPLAALQSSLRDLSRLPSSTGLLVKVTGKVANSTNGWFTLSDGSATVKVLCPGMLGPVIGTATQVTGINCVDVGGRYVRMRRITEIGNVTKATVTAPTGTLAGGLNLFATPYIPNDPTASVVFAGASINGSLYRWDNATQAFIVYNSTTPTVFGTVCPNEGYALISTAGAPLSFQGIPFPTTVDARISFPKRGWSLIASPYITPILWDHVMVSDGEQTLSLVDAVAARWIGRIAFTWDNASGNFGYVGTGARGSRFDDSLRPWKAYWVYTYQDNLALILPAGG